MKLHKINIKRFSFLATLLVLLVFAACEDEETVGLSPTADLESLIIEAEDLIENSEEGTSPGDYQPGAKQKLQDVLIWVDWQIDNASENKEISDAAIKLQAQIEKFKASTVQLAIPIWNNSAGSYIQISDNIKTVLSENNNFTIEVETYYLGPGWIETIFSAGEGDDGAPFGFNLRCFGDQLDLTIGAGPDGWNVTSLPGGAGLRPGEWAHYAVTKSGSEWKVYLNGVEVISNPEGSAETYFRPDVPFAIGESAFWPGRAYNGMIKDFRVWSEVRTPEQLIENKDLTLDGTEDGLEVYFPLDANLGTEFKDNTGNFTATIVGSDVIWAPDGIPPVIELDFSTLDAAITNAQEMKESIVEGENDGDYPVGTKDFIQAAIDNALEIKESAEKQDEVDAATEALNSAVENAEDNLVADAMGVYIDREDPDAVGLRITPNYTPQGDYTVEFDLRLKTLFMESGDNGEIFGNGSFGLRVFGYNEFTEQAIANSGRLWNFTNWNGAYDGPEAPPFSVKSGEWQHVAIVHNQTDNTTAIVVDGVEVALQTGISAPLESGWGEIWLGNSWGGKMNGSIKDFRIWDEAKEYSELDAEIDGSEANLQIYFPLDRVAGVSFSDVTGNYNAELRGIEWNK